MQLLGPDPVQNTVSKSPWLFESKSYEAPVKGGGKKKKSRVTGKVKKSRRNKSMKNKTRRRMPRIYN